MLEIARGQTRRTHITNQIADVLAGETGSLYLGYPVLATADDSMTVDALLVSEAHSVCAFIARDDVPKPEDEPAWRDILDEQDRVYVALEKSLIRHEALRQRRQLAVTVNVVTVFPAEPPLPAETAEVGGALVVSSIGGLKDAIAGFPPMSVGLLPNVEAALQAVTTMKPRKRRDSATRVDSRGGILKTIEQEIAKLDQWQKRAAIETPDGPQRIRGLAGSGKTIVLALKAAYLHAQNPDWDIAVTFYTRSLYQQFRDLIRRFTFEHINDEPDWDKLRVIHAWGGASLGLYTDMAERVNVPPRDFLYGRSRYGMEGAFAGVCGELLESLPTTVEPAYDAILIDEAQDLPPAFFKLAYRFCKEPKRITWAYDELQRLSEASMPTLEEMFGTDENGLPLVQVYNSEGQPQRDIVLRVCYRNPPEVLTAAHAFGLGIYREGGQVQGFDDPGTWTDIGYQLIEGTLQPGKPARLRRAESSYPEYFPRLLDREDMVVVRQFDSDLDQAAWVAESIARNIKDDQLDHDDILVVLPTAYRAKKDASTLGQALARYRVDAHLAGVTTTQDEIFSRNSIAMANIYRSKGNEAAMVYVINAQDFIAPTSQISLRNALFTAATRSRAWVRVVGWGPAMEALMAEFEALKNNGFDLSFTLLTPEELARTRTIHRELTASERETYRRAETNARSLLRAIESGQLELETLPQDLRGRLQRLFATEEDDDEPEQE